MLLVHQAGVVKVGDVVRYTITYTPSADRILPSPNALHLKIRNTSAIPLRAAYLHGPYTLHVCAYPAAYTPYRKLQSTEEGIPEFEPNLKAGGSWNIKLKVPEDIRESGDKANTKRNIDGSPKTVKWVVEIASQILFSNTASVHFELLIGRDQRSVDMGFAAMAGRGHGEPGQIQDFKTSDSRSPPPGGHAKGVYSRSIDLVVEDTSALWNKPPLPQWKNERELSLDDGAAAQADKNDADASHGGRQDQKQKKLHLVLLTHGLHSNIGADLLYLKENIDASAQLAKEEARERRRAIREHKKAQSSKSEGNASGGKAEDGENPKIKESSDHGADAIEENTEQEEDFDDEEVIVRGFPGNQVRTERGIQYLGKRLAKYVLTTTYPDQPVLPKSKSMAKAFTGGFSGASRKSSKHEAKFHDKSESSNTNTVKLPYTFTKISFVGHSLGGLVQTYAIGYIKKHSPEFFDKIKPVNFVAMATPFLGLSNENPLYVKFALDFGLVGRTGQDLGLSWRAPTLARNGWSTMIAGLGAGNAQEQKQTDPRAKPLLRILPSGPAHEVLKMFRNRTIYSNVVNDGIVPLRTSCLLFLDWRSLAKVENAQRESGLIGTVAAFGWSELTGANSTSHRPHDATDEEDNLWGSDEERPASSKAPRSPRKAFDESDNAFERVLSSSSTGSKSSPAPHQFLSQKQYENRPTSSNQQSSANSNESDSRSYTIPNNPISDFIKYIRPGLTKSTQQSSQKVSKKAVKTYRKAQTVNRSDNDDESDQNQPSPPKQEVEHNRPAVTRGDSLVNDPNEAPPPTTSIFDAAGDLLNPPLPPQSWLVDPSKRTRTIFHDRIYHPEDIPAPTAKRPRLARSLSSTGSEKDRNQQQTEQDASVDSSGMKVEEKIARAYHSGMSWRKVLVRLEPDAHNNMIVRRTFANAFGWDVVKHLCDTHFMPTYATMTEDDEEPSGNRAKAPNEPVTSTGEEVEGQSSEVDPRTELERVKTELKEAADLMTDIKKRAANDGRLSTSTTQSLSRISHDSSGAWSDIVFDDEDDVDSDEPSGPFENFHKFWSFAPKKDRRHSDNQIAPQQPAPLARTRMSQRQSGKAAVSRPEIAKELTQTPPAYEQDKQLGAVPTHEAIKPTFQADTEAEPDKVLESPTLLTDVGLKKPPEAHIAASPASPELTRSESVTEHVARLSLHPSNSNSKDDS